MAAGFYTAQYRGAAGDGAGAFYIGNGIITGADVAGGVYDGGYEEVGGLMLGVVRLGIPGGGVLVSGKQVTADQTVEVRFTLPQHFDNGQPQAVSVDGQNVFVTFRKVRDLP